jgi:uncharacterized SAM-binding protein YcdF (DUF218 family)
VEVWRQSPGARLVMTGGVGNAPVSEAEAMRRIALALGVPPDRMVLEDRSTSTIQQAVEVLRLGSIHGWRHVGLVTDRYHLPRARFLFRRMGLKVSGYPVRGTGGGSRRRWLEGVAREIPAWVKSIAQAMAAGRRRRRTGG